MTNYLKFKTLHEQERPLILGNVWNAQSAIALEKAGYEALGTSSAAIAHSLGYNDGEEMSFETYYFIIERICAVTKLPLSVDLEAGYGNTVDRVGQNTVKLSELGVAGINVEDSLVVNGERTFVNPEEFSEHLQKIVQKLKQHNIEMFINVRSDVFLLNSDNAVYEAKRRIQLYENTSIDGIFLPCITDLEEIEEIIRFTSLPVNVMCMPDLPDFTELQKSGVKRISSGNFLNSFIYDKLEEKANEILAAKSFSAIFNKN